VGNLGEYFKEPIDSPDLRLLFLQICKWAMDRRLPEFVIAISEKKDAKKDAKKEKESKKDSMDVGRYLLVMHKFSELSRAFMRKFGNEKFSRDSIAQVYMEYLKEMDKHHLIKRQNPRLITPNPTLDLKFVLMFLDKFISTFKATEPPKDKVELGFYNKIKKATADLKFKIAVHGGNSAEARNILAERQRDLETNRFVYLRSLKAMDKGDQQDANEVFWRQQFLQMFKINL
jgi:hypothetical protein